MSRILAHDSIRDIIFGCAIVLMLLGLIHFPAQSVDAARDGVELCLNVILPSLFPFFVLSTLSVDLGLVSRAGMLLERIMGPLFRVSGACAGAFLLGVVGGYPVGAKTAINLYETGQCSKVETERMLSFCNNSGPAFILGVVGAGIFSSSQAGILLYSAHILASVLVGICFRFYGREQSFTPSHSLPGIKPVPFPAAFTRAVQSAFSSTINISGFVIFFTVLIRLLYFTGIITLLSGFLAVVLARFGLRQVWIESILSGLIEMTSGVWSLRDVAGAMDDKLCMAAFILGWAGLSVHCQVLSFIGSTGLSTRTYFFGKLLHGLLSAGIIFVLSRVIGWTRPVSAYLATEVSTLAALDFTHALMVSACTAVGIFFLLIVISRGYFQKTDSIFPGHRV